MEDDAKRGTLENLCFEMYLNDRCRDSHSGSRCGVSAPCANRLERWHPGGPLVVRAALFVLLAPPIATSTVHAQEAVRMSLAGAQAAQARQDAASTPSYYNLQVGPTYWRFGAGLGFDYNDNITLVQNGQEGDFGYTPSVTTHLLWPISEIQSLNLTLGAGYAGYVQHSYLNRAFITPDSEVSFNIYAGDFVINLHDRFSITENSYQDPTVAGSGAYSQFQNSAGVSALWDLNKLIVKFGYDHASSLELAGGQGQPDQTSEIVSASAGYTLEPGLVVSLDAGGALVNYSTTTTNTPYTDAPEWNVGASIQDKVTEHLSFTADAGYVVSTPQASGALPGALGFSGYYANVGITHRVNQFVKYSLSGGRMLSTMLLGGPTETYTANWSATWTVIQKISIATSFVYVRGTQVGFAGGETFDQYGPEISFGRPITKKMSSSIDYQFLERGSNLPGRAYTLNVVMLNLTYRF